MNLKYSAAWQIRPRFLFYFSSDINIRGGYLEISGELGLDGDHTGMNRIRKSLGETQK